ncbi:MAG: hypothetical protein AAB851_03675, partial [Patescibacteria group bacterium]
SFDTADFTLSVNTLTFDSTNSVIYLGGAGGKFGKYTPATDTATDLTAKISSFWSTNAVNSLTFDSVNKEVYFGGSFTSGTNRFAKYIPVGQILPQNGDIIRIRMSAQVENTPLGVSAQAFKLQYGAVATGAVLTTGLATMSVGQLGFAFGDVYLLMARFLSTMLSFAGIRRRRPKPWGTVYDSQTKQPLDPAYVQLLDEKGNELETQITDLEGRFGFFVKQTGNYSLLANKTNYKFPSGRLSGKSSDELYDNLYFGTPIILEESRISNINLPMDSEKFDWNEFAKKEQGYIKINPKIEIWKRRSQNLIFWTGLISAPVSYLFSPSLFNLAIIGFYFAFVFLRLAGVREKSFGSVYDSRTNQPLSFALITAYYPDVPVKVKSTITDKFGRYYLLIPNGKYYVTVEQKQPDGAYSPVHRSNPFEVKKGVVDREVAV